MSADSKGKWTEGPWLLNDLYDGHFYILPAEDAGKMAGKNFVSKKRHRQEYFREIAMVGRKPYDFDGISVEEQKANVTLMAEAPLLYAELLCARHTLVILDQTPEDSPCIKRIDAVLAKARGAA